MENNVKLMELIETNWKFWKTPGTEATTAKKLTLMFFFWPTSSYVAPIKKQTKIILTVHDHGLLHEVLVHETADFAPVRPAELCGGFPDLEGSVFPEPVCPGHLVVQVDPIFELFADGLRRAPGEPLVERPRVGSEEPFHINLKA